MGFKKICLVAPKHPSNFWSMQRTADILGAKTLMPNSALATLMALTPPDVNVEYVLYDENVSQIDFNAPCDLVAITGSTLHAKRIHTLCKAFREKGKPVALGGTYATIEAEACKSLADYHFIGEAEYTWPLFLRQWLNGGAQPVYRQKAFVRMEDSPAPDWSLIDAHDYVNISVQTSRGCPNRCDFCDVIQYLGRTHRTKTTTQVMQEVRNAHGIGARTIFFSDDNFLGSKRYTKSLLSQVIDWNGMQTRPLSFATQITVQVADDEELLKMFADSRFSVLFLGVETVREASLKEIHKTQNITQDLYERIRRISRFGIVPFIGLIVGFDHDDQTVFDDLHRFILETSCPIAGISLLNAPRSTPLYKRLKKEGRLVAENFSGEWQLYTNIIPKQMTRHELITRYRRLFRKIYEPKAFEARLEAWLKTIGYFDVSHCYKNRKVDWKQLLFGMRIFRHFILKEHGPVRSLFFRAMRNIYKEDPRLMKRFFTLLVQFSHFHHFVHRSTWGEKNR